MTYNDAISCIGSRLRFGIKPGLERIRGLLCRMGDPQDSFDTIHIAGTNGKGSSAKMIAEALGCSGRKTGLFSSPYLVKPTECIVINGEDISEEAFADAFDRVYPLCCGEETEFELLTATAFEAFADSGCEVAVIECGMGGLLDSTNVIAKPSVCVLTKISLDHTAFLGNTLEEIAANKCGIIKPGCTVVSAPYQAPEALAVIKRRCADLNVKLLSCTEYENKIHSVNGLCFTEYKNALLKPCMYGKFQINNAITAFEALSAYGIEKRFIEQGVGMARLNSRCEILSQSPLVLLDGCHNPGAAIELDTALTEILGGKKAVGVAGMLTTKDYNETINILKTNFSTLICCGDFRFNSLGSVDFAKAAEKYLPTKAALTPEDAVMEGIELAKKLDAPLLIFGSLYLAGRIREFAIKKLNEA